MSDRSTFATLFDAALVSARLSYGQSARPVTITIRTDAGLECTFAVPHWWEIEVDGEHPRLSNPTAVADVLATLVEVGHRLTREELCDAMADKGRRRAESVVAEVLAQLMKFGLIDNRQNRNPKGYGIVD